MGVRVGRWTAGLAFAPVGLLLMGAEHPPYPVPPVEHGSSALHGPPGYWAVTTTGDLAAAAPQLRESKVCMPTAGAPPPTPAAAPQTPPPPPAGVERSLDCAISRRDHADGSYVSTMDCRSSVAGVPTSSNRSTTEGTAHDYRMTNELRLAARDGRPERTLHTVTHFVYLGACPPEVKPGEILTSDGTVHDPAKTITAARARGEAGKP